MREREGTRERETRDRERESRHVIVSDKIKSKMAKCSKSKLLHANGPVDNLPHLICRKQFMKERERE